jgi:hypothetical protein
MDRQRGLSVTARLQHASLKAESVWPTRTFRHTVLAMFLMPVASEHCCRAGGVMVVSCTQHRARAARVAATRLHRETRRLLLLDNTTRASDPNAWAYVGISSRREGARLAWESRVRNAVCSPPTRASALPHAALVRRCSLARRRLEEPFGMPVASARRQT